MRLPLRAAALALALVAPLAATADAPLPPTAADLTGARALALGAFRGVPGGNESIYLNGAALAARKRYTVEVRWLLDRVGPDTVGQPAGVSVVDSELSAVAAGVAYDRMMSGPFEGNVFTAAFAAPISGALFAGITGKFLQLDGPLGENVRSGNVDLSLYYQGGLFGIGLAGYNLLSAGHVQQLPRAVGVGVSIGDDRRFRVALDWRGDTQRRPETTSLYAVGVETLLSDMFPVRAGFVHDETRRGTWWSVGTGLVTASGAAVDVAYRQSFQSPEDRAIAVSLKLFLLQ